MLSLSSCTSIGATSPAQPQEAEFVARGVLTIGTDPTYPPQEFIQPDGAVSGFDVDLARGIAARLGRRLRVVPTPSRDLLTDLFARRVDAVVSAMTTGGDRNYGARFVPYLKVTAAFVSTAESTQRPRRPEQLCGLRVGVLQNSAQAETVRGLSVPGMSCHDRPVREVALPSLSAAVDQLKAGACDVLYVDGPPALALGHARRDLYVTIDGDPNRQAVTAVALRRQDDALKSQITIAFASIRADGSYRALLARWGLEVEDIDRPTDPLAS